MKKLKYTYLNVCILCEELDESFKAIKAVPGDPNYDFNDLIVFVSLFQLVSVVFEDYADELHQCD